MTRPIRTILIIGGGPAGAVAGVLLARAGLDVTLVERQRFPRDKVCGECISATGLATLGRSGLGEVLGRLGPAELTRATLVGPDGVSATHELGLPMWGLTRRRMDTALIAEVAAAGGRVLQPARAESVDSTAGAGGEGVRVVVRHEDNRIENLSADLAIVADGKSALMGDAGKPAATTDLGIKAHFRGVRADGGSIHLFTLAGHYGGLAAVEDGLWNVALSVPQELVRAGGGDLAGLWAGWVEGNPFLRAAFAGAERQGEFLASPLPRFAVRNRWPVGVIPVGNAAAALEPIGGEGMGLAMRSAELAAGAIVAGVKEGRGVDLVGLRREFARLWRTRRPACRTVAIMMSQPAIARAVIPFSRSAESATRAVLGLMGKKSAG